jgi:hypothetical protein
MKTGESVCAVIDRFLLESFSNVQRSSVLLPLVLASTRLID